MATVDEVDPTAARNGAEFVKAMRQLQVAAGKPSIRELSRRAARSANTDVLPASTLSDTLRKDRLPQWHVVTTFLKVCGVSPQAVTPWQQTWQRLAEPDDSAGDTREPVNVDQEIKADPVPRRPSRHLGRRRPAHPKQEDAAAEELATWLRRTLLRPKRYVGEERRGLVTLDYLSPAERYTCDQVHLHARLKFGEDVRCHAEHPLVEYTTLYHCYVQDEDADTLVTTDLPELFWATIKCLGQVRVIDNDMLIMHGDEDEDRGVSYYTAYLLSKLAPPD